MERMPLEVQKAVLLALRKASQWHPPPNWDEQQWREELQAVAWATAWEAQCVFDHSRNVPLQAFVFLRVKAALKDFLRREWAYAHRCVSLHQIAESSEEDEDDDFTLMSLHHADENAWRRLVIRWALLYLSEKERDVIEGIFWFQRTEAEIAKQLRISQQAVSKIKRRALQRLKETLSELDWF